MSLLVIGTVAYDSVKTPSGTVEEALGGSATYFSFSSNHFKKTELIAAIGEDFKKTDIHLFEKYGIGISGLQTYPGKTFRWSGLYHSDNLNKRDTIKTDLNVLANFNPEIKSPNNSAEHLFLANIDPELQINVLEQMKPRPKLIGIDSMDFWIKSKKIQLEKLFTMVDVLFLDENEAKMVTGKPNLFTSAESLSKKGTKIVIIKRGEFGSIVFYNDSIFYCPAYPIKTPIDPTGAGDSFAGGVMGYLASCKNINNENIRKASIFGSVMGSFAVESFSINQLESITKDEIINRFEFLYNSAKFSKLNTKEIEKILY